MANRPIRWARDCLTVRLKLLSWEIEAWDSLRVRLELQDHVIRDPAPQKGAGSWGALQVSTQALARLAATLQQMRRCPGQRQRRQARFNRLVHRKLKGKRTKEGMGNRSKVKARGKQRQLAKTRVAAHALVAVRPKEGVEHAWMDDVLQEEERTRDSKLLSEHKALATTNHRRQ